MRNRLIDDVSLCYSCVTRPLLRKEAQGLHDRAPSGNMRTLQTRVHERNSSPPRTHPSAIIRVGRAFFRAVRFLIRLLSYSLIENFRSFDFLLPGLGTDASGARTVSRKSLYPCVPRCYFLFLSFWFLSLFQYFLGSKCVSPLGDGRGASLLRVFRASGFMQRVQHPHARPPR